MQKLVLDVPLECKPTGFAAAETAVEKIVHLSSEQFDRLRDHPLDDHEAVKAAKPYMWSDEKQTHCVLFLDTESGNGILVDSEGYDYARYAAFVPNARDMANTSEMSGAEWNLHDAVQRMAQRIAELAHKGDRVFDTDTMLAQIGCDPTELLTTAVIAALQDREDIRFANYASDICIRTEPKPMQTMMLYSPVAFRTAEPVPRTIMPENACLVQKELQQYLTGLMEDDYERGFMEGHRGRDSLNEKVFTAIPRFEIVGGALMLATKCQIAEPLTELELAELKEEIRWQLADHVKQVEDEQPVQTPLGALRAYFWDEAPEWSMQTSEELEAAMQEECEELTEPIM